MKKKVDLIGVGVHVSTVWSHNEQKEGERKSTFCFRLGSIRRCSVKGARPGLLQEMRVEWLTGRPVVRSVTTSDGLYICQEISYHREPNLGEPEMAIVPIVSTEFHRDGAIIDSIPSRPDPVRSDDLTARRPRQNRARGAGVCCVPYFALVRSRSGAVVR